MHKDGEIFSSALMNMELVIGRETTHRILFASLPFLLPNYNMPQSAQVFIDSDSSLYDGAHSVLMNQVFLSRGIDPGLIIVANPKEQGGADLPRLLSPVAQENSLILFNPKNFEGEAFLTDQNGRVLRTFRIGDEPGRMELSVAGIPAGLYFLTVQSTNQRRVFKILRLP
jgi:hypothetical protein